MSNPINTLNNTLLVPLGAAALTLCVASTSHAYKELETFEAGTISGTVRLEKPVPAPEVIKVTKDPGVCGKNQEDERYKVGKDKGLANVVVYIEKIRKGKKVGTPEASVDNTHCSFTPHVSAFPVGTKLWVKNSDTVLHNTHTYLDERTLFNVALPMKGVKVPKMVKEPGVIQFRCDAGHTWMNAWAVVTEHPYVTVTDADGKFSLADVPAGRYRLKAWHEVEGEKRSDKVKLSAGADTSVNFMF